MGEPLLSNIPSQNTFPGMVQDNTISSVPEIGYQDDSIAWDKDSSSNFLSDWAKTKSYLIRACLVTFFDQVKLPR